MIAGNGFGYVFQFHTGSIKRLRIVAGGFRLLAWFQFHTGSIKSWLRDYDDINQREAGFNSTLVRLKDSATMERFQVRLWVSIPHWFD